MTYLGIVRDALRAAQRYLDGDTSPGTTEDALREAEDALRRLAAKLAALREAHADLLARLVERDGELAAWRATE